VVRTERHRDVLRLQEHLVAPGAAFAPGARGLGAAEGLAQVAHVLAVDEAHAGFDRRGHAVRAADVLGPDVADRPYWMSLAMRIASASSSNGIRQATGPKISSCAIFMRLSTSANTVGAT
jgi:hypothetical protein